MRYTRFARRLIAATVLCGAAGLPAAAQATDSLPARVVVRLKPAGLPPGLTVQQIQQEMRKPLGASAVATLSARAGVALTYVRPLSDGSHVMIPTDPPLAPPIAQVATSLRRAPEIERAEEDLPIRAQFVPSDTEYLKLWNLKPAAGASFGADFQAAWELTRGTGELRIAVIDTGLLPHPDLVGPGGTVSPPTGILASEGYDFISDCRIRASCAASTPPESAAVAPAPNALDRGDWISDADRATSVFSGCTRRSSSWHGTHVAGIATALGDNGAGVVGGAFASRLVPVRVLGKCGGYASDVAEGVRWAAGVHATIPNGMPARVLNLSLGGSAASCPSILQSAIDAATAAGAVVVVAAGNETTDAADSVPANCRNVVAVAATTQLGDLAYYSNRSATVIALSAPGGDLRSGSAGGILSALNTGSTVHDEGGWIYAAQQGTSSAAPHVAAAAALALARNPSLTPVAMKALLTAPTSVTPFALSGVCATTGGCGAGILNAQRVVENAVSPLRPLSALLDFGAVALSATAVRELAITNVSGSAVSIDRASLSGSAGFALSADECSTRTLGAGDSCRLAIVFAAATTGTASATLLVPTASRAEVLATAVTLTAAAGSKLVSAQQTVALPSVPVASAASVVLTFTNQHQQAERVMSLALSNDAIAAISSDKCSNAELAPGQSCDVTITVSPTAAGEFSVGVTANTAGAQDVPYTVTVKGTAVASTSQNTGDAPSGTRAGAEVGAGTSTGSDTEASTSTGAAGRSGGGGCTLLRAGSAAPDATLAIAALAMLAWRRLRRTRHGADRV